MDIDLTAKRAIVSGSTAGIGLAIATGLAKAGAEVVINGRTEERVQKAIDTIQAEVPGATLSGVAADLGTPEGAAKLADEASVPLELAERLARRHMSVAEIAARRGVHPVRAQIEAISAGVPLLGAGGFCRATAERNIFGC